MALISMPRLDMPDADRMLWRVLARAFPSEAADLCNGIIARTAEYWSLALQDASPWGARAASTLTVERMGDEGEASVSHDSGHPEAMFYGMVEEGVRSWSIKDALLRGKRAKKSASGERYATVPFRWRTPGKLRPTASFAGVMSPDAGRLAAAGKIVGPEHGHLAGLKRYGEGVHSRYMTFRSVSERSTGWQYPAIPATPVFEKVEKAVERLAREAVGNWIADKVRELSAL